MLDFIFILFFSKALRECLFIIDTDDIDSFMFAIVKVFGKGITKLSIFKLCLLLSVCFSVFHPLNEKLVLHFIMPTVKRWKKNNFYLKEIKNNVTGV